MARTIKLMRTMVRLKQSGMSWREIHRTLRREGRIHMSWQAFHKNYVKRVQAGASPQWPLPSSVSTNHPRPLPLWLAPLNSAFLHPKDDSKGWLATPNSAPVRLLLRMGILCSV